MSDTRAPRGCVSDTESSPMLPGTHTRGGKAEGAFPAPPDGPEKKSYFFAGSVVFLLPCVLRSVNLH